MTKEAEANITVDRLVEDFFNDALIFVIKSYLRSTNKPKEELNKLVKQWKSANLMVARSAKLNVPKCEDNLSQAETIVRELLETEEIH